jgi:hypothetical protein
VATIFGSSSTMRMRCGIYCGTAAVRTAPGTTIENFAPPATFSAQIRPPAAASSPLVIESPIPVPNVV